MASSGAQQTGCFSALTSAARLLFFFLPILEDLETMTSAFLSFDASLDGSTATSAFGALTVTSPLAVVVAAADSLARSLAWPRLMRYMPIGMVTAFTTIEMIAMTRLVLTVSP